MIVRYEDGKWINNIGVYFEILREINDDTNKLLRLNPNYNNKIEVLFFDVAVNLARIFPIRRKKIDYSQGILKLEKYFEFLRRDYHEIFKKYKKEVITINDMRDKFEHVPHIIRWREYIGDKKYKKMIFINDEYNLAIIEGNKKEIEIKKNNKEYLEWEIDTDMLIKIVISLDETFLKIQSKLYSYFEGKTEALNHPYIKNILDIDIDEYIKQFN